MLRQRGHGVQSGVQFGVVLQIEPHRTGFGLVRQPRGQCFQHHRVTQGGRIRQHLCPAQHLPDGHRHAKPGQGLFGAGFIEQPGACQRQGHGRLQGRDHGHPVLCRANVSRMADRVQAVGQALHRGNAPGQQLAGHRLWQALGQRGHHQATRAVSGLGGHKGIDRGLPGVRRTAVLPGKIQHQQVGIKAAIQQAGKTLGLGRQVAPDVGVVIERVGHIHLIPQHRVQALVRRRRQGRHLQAARLRQVGHQ